MNKKAFTLVELIVVITILAILGTIAFLSFSGYSSLARDAIRKSDLSSIETSLELYITKTGNYPIPSEITNITYSGAVAWNQGVAGDSVITNLEKLNDVPLDPLYFTEYAYSTTHGKKEYQLGAILENGGVSYSPVKQANAAGIITALAYVVGTYNGQVIEVSTGSVDYILAVPSILASDINDVDMVYIINNSRLVYDGYQNLPASYADTELNVNGGFDYIASDIVVYTGSSRDFYDSQYKRMKLFQQIQNAYSGTILSTHENYKQLIDVTIDVGNPGYQAHNLAIKNINNVLGERIPEIPAESYWAKRMGGVDWEGGYYLDTDNDGNIYITGEYSNVGPFLGEDLVDTGGGDIFIAKLNSLGELQWLKTGGGDENDYGWDLVVDTLGNVIVSGKFKGENVTLFGESIVNTGGPANSFVVKLDTNGSLVRKKYALGTDAYITSDASNNVYVSGTYSGTVVDVYGVSLTSTGAGVNSFIAKLDSNGNTIWVNQASNAAGGSIETDSRGNIYVSGLYSGVDVNVFGTLISSSGPYEGYLAKLNQNGNAIWVKQAISDMGSSIWRMRIDDSGNVYVQGDYSGTSVNIFGDSTASADWDTFVVKLNSSGELIWFRQAGGPGLDYSGYGIPASLEGNIYVSGNFSGTAIIFGESFDDRGNDDMFVSKLNPDGGVIWTKQIGSSSWDWITGIQTDNSGNLYALGSLNGTLNTHGETLIDEGSGDIFLLKMDKDGNIK